MLNRNSSDRIAAKKWFKCSLLQRPSIILAMLMLCAVFSCQEIEKPKEPKEPKEPTITLTQSDLMVIYENGYLNGKLNIQLHSTDGKSGEVWSIDSFNISKRFFK